MWAEKARFAFSVAGVAVAALLLSFGFALYSGWNEKIADYVEEVPADVWAPQAGNESFFTISLVPDAALEQIAAIDGVTEVSSLFGRPLKVRHGDKEFDAHILGYDTDGFGGPIDIKRGADTVGPGEIIVDDVLARTHGVGIGDELVANDRTLRIVGISTGGNLVINQLAFVTKEEAQALVGIPGFSNFVLIRTEPGQSEAVIERINSDVPGVTAFSSEEFADNTRQVIQRSILPILAVVLGLVFLVGSVVVGLTIYTATVEKEREYGVMKALGTPNKFLFLAVVEQSLICGLLGFIIGQFGVIAASRFAERLVPQFVTLIRWQDALIVFVSVAIMCLVASYVPVQRVMRVDPMRVFKA
jgi:putative ABC transport system permease protein